jgi:hypothetical protein
MTGDSGGKQAFAAEGPLELKDILYYRTSIRLSNSMRGTVLDINQVLQWPVDGSLILFVVDRSTVELLTFAEKTSETAAMMKDDRCVCVRRCGGSDFQIEKPKRQSSFNSIPK